MTSSRPRSSLPAALIAMAFLAFISLGLPDGLPGVTWPFIRETFDRPLGNLGILLICGTGGYLFSGLAGGSIVRRTGLGLVLTVSSAAMVVALLTYALTPSFYLLIPAAILGGLASGAIDTGINLYGARRFSPRVMNWLHGSWGLGATAGPLLMTAAITTGAGWRWGYALIALILAGMGVMFLITMRRWEEARESGGQGSGTATAVAPVAHALRHPVLWLNAGLFMVYCGVEMAAGQWLFTLLTRMHGIDVGTAGTVAGLYWGALTFGRLVFGQVTARVRPLNALRVGLAIAMVSALLFAWFPTPAVGMAAALGLGFGLAPTFPTLVSLTPLRVGDAIAPHAVGFQMTAAGAGATIVPGALGWLAQHLGLSVLPVWLVLGMVLLIGLSEFTERLVRRRAAGSLAAVMA
ncbi:sugar MFS transporter [Niveispirillum sp.]|uniref:MFS transporter n=1 Tax=Niveispirillum sp. TaxID=1917217 RepID=UPI001B70334B|nr:MFS transporter [Niveispirillum sp.]MBP7334582.1 MFS transporter [Niveispirillum sp.]